MPRSFQRGLWETSFSGSYFSASGNYSSTGGLQTLTSGNSYSLLDTLAETRYVFAPGWAFSGGLESGYAQSNTFSIPRTSSGLSSGNLGIESMFGMGPFELIPEVSFVFPFLKDVPDQDTVMRSEGVNETHLDLHLQAAFQDFTLFGRLGYELRGSGRSTLMPWSAGLEFQLPAARLGARLYGEQTIANDGDTGDGEAARLVTINRINGGSLKYYSVNPSLVDSEIYLLFGLSRNFRMALSGGTTLTGSNSGAGYHGEGTLIYRFAAEPVRRTRPRNEEHSISVDPYVEKFHEDTNDGVDQQLFRPPPPPKPAPQPVRMRREKPEPSPEAAAAERERIDKEKMQNELDKAEMSIELKVDKKKKRKNTDPDN